MGLNTFLYEPSNLNEFERSSQSESVRIIPTSDIFGLKNGAGFVLIQSFELTWID